MTDDMNDVMNTCPYLYFLGVHFIGNNKTYYFGTNEEGYEVGDHVVVESLDGLEIAIVSKAPESTKNYHSNLSLSPVIRPMSRDDKRDYEDGLRNAKVALEITKTEVARLSLPMRLLDARFSLDGYKCTITYTADSRVDFRELLKILAPKLHCRIELRQIAPRDKARAIGGLGPCGLPLCCSTFLNSFDGISISRAKNQMLSLNIPKLSGACGKLMCCLAYEDDLYTEERKRYPKIGSILVIKGVSYRVDNFNILSSTVRLVSDAETISLSLDELNAKLRGEAPKPKETPKPVDSRNPRPIAKNQPQQQNQRRDNRPFKGKRPDNNAKKRA